MHKKIEIIHEPSAQEPYIIISKKSGIPSAPLKESETDNALSLAIELFPEIKNVNGKKAIEYGLLHRIDTDTSGLLMIATSQDFYEYMMNEQCRGRFIKTYKAVCNIDVENPEKLGGFPVTSKTIDVFFENKKVVVESYFRNYGEGLKSVRPVTEDSGKAALKKLGNKKLYSTEILIVEKDEKNNIAHVECKIKAGYRHQVRCHLAWCGFPIKGDRIYNRNCKDEDLMFKATGLKFNDPVTGKIIEYVL